MNSNSFFSISRFLYLMQNDFLLNYKKYLFTIAGALIVGYIILYMQMPTREYSPDFNVWNYSQTFLMCLLGLGAFIGMSFPVFSSKTSSMSYLLLPSSNFEKFMSQFLIRIVFGTVLFFIIFWIDARLARATALEVLSQFEHMPSIKPFEFSNIFYNIDHVIDKLVLIGCMVSIGTYLYSVRLFFKKLALVKTVISMAAAVVFMIFLFIALSHVFYPGNYGWELKLNTYNIYKRYGNMDIWIYAIFLLSWIFFLPLGYFKLKEKQV